MIPNKGRHHKDIFLPRDSFNLLLRLELKITMFHNHPFARKLIITLWVMLLSIALHSVSFLANFDRQINMSHELMTLNFCAKNTVNDLRENSEGIFCNFTLLYTWPIDFWLVFQCFLLLWKGLLYPPAFSYWKWSSVALLWKAPLKGGATPQK